MALVPHPSDPNKAAELKRMKEDPASFGDHRKAEEKLKQEAPKPK